MGRLSYGQPVGTWHYPGAAGVLKRKNRKKRKKKGPWVCGYFIIGGLFLSLGWSRSRPVTVALLSILASLTEYNSWTASRSLVFPRKQYPSKYLLLTEP